MVKKVILDMDPGVDDAVAIAVALAQVDLDIQLITSVAGNVSVDKTTLNVLKMLEFFGKADQIPVAAGASSPLKKIFEDASYVHGESGMPGYDFPLPTHSPIDRQAVDAIHDALDNASEPITIIATGSYTNIANLINQYPDQKNIKELILMGGSISGGNVSSVAEFNVYTDPDAAKIVFESGWPITMIGLDVTLKALLFDETIEKLKDFGEVGEMIHGVVTAYNDVEEGGKPMHDVNTILYAVDPSFIETRPATINVVTEGPAIGATVDDFQHRWNKENYFNAKVGINIDVEKFNQWFLEQVSKMKK